MTEHRYRPPHVEAAIVRGDSAFLSHCGKIGNRRKREIAEAVKVAEEAAEAEKWADIKRLCNLEAPRMARARNEHIIGPNGTDKDFTPPYQGPMNWD